MNKELDDKDRREPTAEQIEAAWTLYRYLHNDRSSDENPSIIAAFLARRDADLLGHEYAWRDSVWYDAMKWAGIGGLMRVKVQRRVIDLVAALRANDAEEKKS